MKTALKYLTIVGLAIAALVWPTFKVSSTEGEEELDAGENVTAREAFRRLQLQDENGQIPPNGLIDAYAQKENMPFLPQAWAEFAQSSQATVTGSEPGELKESDPGVLVGGEPDAVSNPWASIGPYNIGGRIKAIVIHPTATPRILWAGSASGGVWKSIDDGVTWTTNTDFLANLGVRCLAIDAADPDTLYAGSGGIFKTTNGGATWKRLKSTNPVEHPDFSYINRLAICPTNSQLLLAATSPDDYGGKIYRSTDAGENWSLAQIPAAVNVRILDVRFQPHNVTAEPEVQAINCVAGTAGNGAYYSNDGGATWTKATGLPVETGQVELAYSRSSPAIVYASLTAGPGLLYRSINGGHHFDWTGPGPNGKGTTAWVVANALWVDPLDPDTVVVGGVFLFRTTDHGGTWAEASSTEIHLDHQVIVEDPAYGQGTGTTRNAIVYGGNDGGIHRTNNILASSPPFPSVHWTSLNNNLAVTQFYGAAGHVVSGKIIGGTQDNGTVVSPAPGSLNNWTIMQGSLGGDGGFCAVDQTDDPYFYGENLMLQIYRSINGGETKQYIYDADPEHPLTDANFRDDTTGSYANGIAPFILDPNDASGQTLLAGGRHLWRSTNARNSQPSWFAIKDAVEPADELRNISAIAIAPGNSNIIWVGHNDGSVYYTTNGMDGDPTWVERDGGLPHGLGHKCTRITIGQAPPADPPNVGRTVYVTFSGFNDNNVWKTQNNGQTWESIHHSLPYAPIYSLVISPSNPSFLYVGTEVGVFASSTGGATWSPGNGGPANVPVEELFWMGPQLFAATLGRSIFKLAPADH